MKAIEVAVPVPLNKTFSYLPPEHCEPESIVGKRVKVNFANKTVTAYALSVQEIKSDVYKLKKIESIIDSEPIINKESLRLAEYIIENYICSPAKLWQLLFRLQ